MLMPQAETIWTFPINRVDAPTARRRILAQHERIRGLLERARTVADQALDELPLPADAVASAIGDIRATLDVHLSFEERVLCDILEDDLPLGPERAARLREDHAKQRATLATLHTEARAAPQRPLLAAKLAFLTSWLLEDMEEEERRLLTSEAVRDDAVAIDQCTG
jgi:hypothetical protein